MKILFIFPHVHEYDSQSVREKPSGGTEKTVIFLGEAFQKLGHEVQWITTLGQFADTSWPDVVITQEAKFLERFSESKKVWWLHHFADQPIIQRNAPWGRIYADTVVSLSVCQRDDIRQQLRVDSTIIPHGVWLDECHVGAEKDPYRLIYASTPFRGLERVPELFKAIRAVEPKATISICSSMKTYGTPEKDAEYKHIFDELATIEGVELKGSLNQAELYAEYARASIFFYPCTWRETYCLAMDEAAAHRCHLLTTDVGALPERTSAAQGIEHLAQACLDAFQLPEYWGRRLTVKQQPKDWLDVAREWEERVLNA